MPKSSKPPTASTSIPKPRIPLPNEAVVDLTSSDGEERPINTAGFKHRLPSNDISRKDELKRQRLVIDSDINHSQSGPSHHSGVQSTQQTMGLTANTAIDVDMDSPRVSVVELVDTDDDIQEIDPAHTLQKLDPSDYYDLSVLTQPPRWCQRESPAQGSSPQSSNKSSDPTCADLNAFQRQHLLRYPDMRNLRLDFARALKRQT